MTAFLAEASVPLLPPSRPARGVTAAAAAARARAVAASQARVALWIMVVVATGYMTLLCVEVLAYTIATERAVPSVAWCFTGRLDDAQFPSLSHARECGTLQASHLVDRLAPDGHIFAAVRAKNLSAWPLLARARRVRELSRADGRYPRRACPSLAQGLPPPSVLARFGGWKQCLQLVGESERELGDRYEFVAHVQVDLCVPKPLPVRLSSVRPELLAHGGVVSAAVESHADGEPACSDVLAIVPRRYAEAFFSALAIDWSNCSAAAEAWPPWPAAAVPAELGALALGAWLARAGIRCDASDPRFSLD